MKLIDTSVWVHAYSKDSPKRESARDKINLLLGLDEAAVTIQIIAEFYSAMTKTLASDVAANNARKLIGAGSLYKLETSLDDVVEALYLSEKNNLRRSEIFDALIVATGRRNGVEGVITDNKEHFERLGMNVETI
ncbi:MAG: PIN domain-containing protein [Candidatus Altiarchaeota archaeon]|nr:PIN domain-containing protein [Candidatus Altiarchaeota archaeon]